MIQVKKEIEKIMSQCEIYVDRPEKPIGGQQAGIQVYPTVIEHKDLGLKISICYYRSNFKNRLQAMISMESLLKDLIK